MPHDYRYDPFNDTSEAIAITGEIHIIPSNSPYTIRLNEVPMKDTPSSISLTIGGVAANEVSAPPAAGEFWPDYSTKADNDDSWNTGTILFNAADAGKTVVVSYIGTGSLVDIEKTRKLHKCIKFTSSGEWICPEGVEHVNILLIGGGGGGSGNHSAFDSGTRNGGNGGASSFGTLITAGGGQGALKGEIPSIAGIGSVSSEFLILRSDFSIGVPGTKPASAGHGNDATGHGNGGGNAAGSVGAAGMGSYVNSNGQAGTSSSYGGAAGGCCLYAVAVPVTAGTSYTITIGAGGIGYDYTYDGGDGAPGLCVIWY